MRSSFLLSGLIVSSFILGCAQPLTPQRVRELLEAPTGTVGEDTIGRTTRDFFSTRRASQAHNLANFLKLDSADVMGIASGAVQMGDASMQAALAAEGTNVGDVFCAAGMTTALAGFDACQVGQECDADFTLDACVLRLGDGPDENARGKISFKLKNSIDTGMERSELRLTFEDFERTFSATQTAYLDGLVAVETSLFSSEADGGERVEVVVTADLTAQERNVERGFLDDGVITSTRSTGAVRFTAESADDSAAVSADLLAFVDDSDDTRNDSVVVSFAAEANEIAADQTLANATVDVRGQNGTFSCNFTAAEESLDRDGGLVKSAGSCIDAAGEVFSFDAQTTAR